ncbi:MAG: DUF4827 family protein, partial [Muribaculaceae bacterium]
MKTKNVLYLIILSVAVLATSCDDTKSYSELLDEETKHVNAYLANQVLINEIPADSIFEAGVDAPYYRIDNEGNVYMQVVKYGTQGDVKDDQQVYFRYTRYD